MKDALKIVMVGKDPAVPLLLQTLLGWSQRTAISVLDESYQQAAENIAYSQYYHPHAHVRFASYEACKTADIILFFQDELRQQAGKSNLELLKRQVQKIMQTGFYGKIIVATKNSNAAASEIKRLSGLPAQQIIAIGTLLLTRFVQFQLATRFQISSQNIHSYVIGDSEARILPLWSRSYVGVKPLLSYIAEQNELLTAGDLQKLEQTLQTLPLWEDVATPGMETAVVFGILEILEAIAFDQSKVLTVGIEVNTKYAVSEPTFLSLPAVIGKEGVVSTLEINLTEQEQKRLAQIIAEQGAQSTLTDKEGE